LLLGHLPTKYLPKDKLFATDDLPFAAKLVVIVNVLQNIGLAFLGQLNESWGTEVCLQVGRLPTRHLPMDRVFATDELPFAVKWAFGENVVHNVGSAYSGQLNESLEWRVCVHSYRADPLPVPGRDARWSSSRPA